MPGKFKDISNNTSFSDIELSSDQVVVFNAIVDWLNTLPGSHLTVGGYAGTGKTTLISLLRKRIHEANEKTRVGFCSYIGKASENLRRKLVEAKTIYKTDSCGTIHRLMYKPEINSKGEIVRWNKIKKIDVDLIIIDEASMITEDIWFDLLSYDIPIIAFGDHGQLPPIGDDFSLMDKPDLRLEKIHRQSEGNHIIKLATSARLGEKINIYDYDKKVRKMARKSDVAEEFSKKFFEDFDDDSLVLVGTNNTRIKLNKAIRDAKNIESEEPVVGDKVVCLKNIYDNPAGDIFNGMTGVLKEILPFKDHWYLVTIDFPNEERVFEGKISKYQFNEPKPVRKVKGVPAKKIGYLFDFGYALTVHKAQGSEAKRVLVVDESYVFRYRDEAQGRKWLYTALTRAQEELYILG